MSSSSHSLDVAQQLDVFCQRYEAAWRQAAKGGSPPCRADFLAEAPTALRHHLEPELLALDQHYYHANTASDSQVCIAGVERHRPTAPPGYEILGELGRGGMGIVYQARQLELQRIVALKMLAPHGPLQARAIARFRREAETVAQLCHPSIVQIYEFGESKGVPWLALEYVAGGSLDRQLAGAPQSARSAAQLVLKLAEAIEYAHQHGVVHRDLKPANILLQDGAKKPPCGVREAIGHQVIEGRRPDATLDLTAVIPRITDFGLAKCLDLAATSLTGTGDLLGTPGYMAPEQTQGKPEVVGPLADVYGLGALLYELLTGRPPFRAESVMETIFQVRNEEPVSPSRLQPHLPRDLVTICLKCLEKDPQRRYPSAAAVAEDLRRFLDHEPIRARSVGAIERTWKWARRRPAIAGLLVAVMLALVGGLAATGWQWHRAERRRLEAEEANRAKEAVLDRQRIALAHREWLANNAARAELLLDECSNDQRHQWEWKYLRRLCRSDLATFHEPTAPVRSVAFRPDGRKLAAACDDGVVLIWTLEPEPVSRLVIQTGSSGGIQVAFHPTADCLIAVGGAGIQLWQASTGVLLGNLDREPGTGVPSCLAVAQGDGRLAVGYSDGVVRIYQALEHRLLMSWQAHLRTVSGVAWTPDGRQLATASFDRSVRLHDLEKWQIRKQLPNHQYEALCVAISPDGQSLASGGWDWKVRVYDLVRERERFQLGDNTTPIAAVAFSPDARRLATAGFDGTIKVCDANTGQILNTLHGHTGAVWSITFHPDGWRLVSGSSDRQVKLHDITTNPEFITVPGPQPLATAFAFDPTGRRLAVGQLRERVSLFDTWTRLAIRSFPHQGPIQHLAWNATGELLAAVGARQSLRCWEVATGKQVSLHGLPPVVHAFRWTGADHFLAVCGEANLELWAGDRNGSRALGALSPDTVRSVRFSPDGEYLVVHGQKSLSVYTCSPIHCVREIPARGDVTALALNDTILALGTPSGTIELYPSASTGAPLVIQGHYGAVSALALHPGGGRLASTGSDWNLKLWDTQTGQETLFLQRHLHQRSVLAFSPAGNHLAGTAIDLHQRIWSAEEPAELLAPDRLEARLRAWEENEARTAESQSLWFGAEFHLTRLLTLTEDIALRGRRCRARLEMQRWVDARLDQEQVVAARPDQITNWRTWALLELATERPREFQRVWQAMFDRFSASTVQTELATVAYAGLIAPPNLIDSQVLLDFLERRLGLAGRVDRRMAAVMARAGRPAETIRQYDILRKRSPRLRAWDWFFLTLAHAQLGQHAQAGACWNQAHNWLAEEASRHPSGQTGAMPWYERVEVELLRREVETALKGAAH